MWGGMHGKGHNPMHDKWMKMTPEQRKEFINKRKKFGFGKPFEGPFGGPFGRPFDGPFGEQSDERSFFDDGRFGMNNNDKPDNQPKEPKKENE